MAGSSAQKKPVLSNLFTQFKKAELGKKVINQSEEETSFLCIIKKLQLVPSKALASQSISCQIDVNCRAIIDVLNDRISALWNFKNVETKLINALYLSKEILIAKFTFLSLIKKYQQQSVEGVNTKRIVRKSNKEFLLHFLETGFEDMVGRVDLYISNLLKTIISQELSQFYLLNHQFYRRKPEFSLDCSCSGVSESVSSNNPFLHRMLKRLTIEYLQNSLQETKFLPQLLQSPALTQSSHLPPIDPNQDPLTQTCSTYILHVASIMLESCLTSFLNSLLLSKVAIDESGLQLFFQNLLYVQELVHEMKSFLRIYDSTVRLWENMAPLIRAREILEILKLEVYPLQPAPSSQPKEASSIFGSSHHTIKGKSERSRQNSLSGSGGGIIKFEERAQALQVQGSSLQENERLLWQKLIVRKSSSRFNLPGKFSSWRQKHKGAVFVSLQLDIDGL
jgi:hypothetical protein